MFRLENGYKGAALCAALVIVIPLLNGIAMAQNTDAEIRLGDFLIVEGDTLWLVEPLEVVGSRVPAALPGLVRGVGVLTEDDITDQPHRSVAGLLQTVPGVIVSQRQQYGVQSDITMRGSTFEQVQILLNGFDASDPQTGHHLMNLPLARNDISRLEVLPGHGSALYGSGAFGGTVNVATIKPSSDFGGYLEATAGGNGTWGAGGNFNLPWGEGDRQDMVRVSVNQFHTDGYDVRQADGSEAWGGNDADVQSLTVASRSTGNSWEAETFFGYGNREFGALGFYAPYPSWEHTRTMFAYGLYRRQISDRITLEPRLYGRSNTDLFLLKRDDPGYYTNDHRTGKVGAELRGVADLGHRRSLAVSLEGVYSQIEGSGLWQEQPTSGLGDHLRRRASLALELDQHGGPLRWQIGGRADLRTSYSPQLSVSAAVSRDLNDIFTLRASTGSVYRIPTFTELYYRSPDNMGNPQLNSENGWAYDVGLDYYSGPWQGQFSVFRRFENDLIEWARPGGDTVWQVQNIGDATVTGLETQHGWHSGAGHGLVVGWSWVEKETELPRNYEGKYSLLVPQHVLTAQGHFVLPANFALTVTGRYQEHSSGPDDFRVVFMLDSRLHWTGPAGLGIDVVGTNLLDRCYEEVPGVQMPSRLLTGTVGWKF